MQLCFLSILFYDEEDVCSTTKKLNDFMLCKNKLHVCMRVNPFKNKSNLICPFSWVIPDEFIKNMWILTI